MSPFDIRNHLRRLPFTPFRLYMTDGAAYDVRHPEMAFISGSEMVISTKLGEDDMPYNNVYCDPSHVTRIELLNSSKPKAKSDPEAS